MSVKLVCFKAETGNVGDDFSAWLFSRSLGAHLNDESSTILFGVGSILDRKIDEAFSTDDTQCRLVFGSGARSSAGAPDVSGRDWKIYCVRGPLTASALSLPPGKAVADPGILIPVYRPVQADQQGPIGIVPYFTSSEDAWRIVANRLNWTLISPHLGVEDFIDQLTRCSRVFCESMHGAIFADAYRIPWRPLSGTGLATEGATHAFKWTDWTSSMGLAFDSIRTPIISRFIRNSTHEHLKQRIKAVWISRILAKAVREDHFLLSRDTVLQSRQEQLQSLMDALRRDVAAGLA
jgi:succinoglycan biosynthesis protein ExoV